MDMFMNAALSRASDQEEFERSLVEAARAEMQKTASSRYLDGIFGGNLTPGLDRFSAQMKVAAKMGKEMAKEAGIASAALSAVKPLAGKALGYAAMHPQQAMAAGGAAVGAVGGAVAGGPGHRMSGALGGAALGGAAGYGASKLPGGYGQKAMRGVGDLAARGYGAMGSPKLAGALGMLGKAGIGAAVGGIGGALHQSGAERQGLEAGHHMRNALLGAAGGAAVGAGASKLPGMAAKLEGSAARAEGAAMRSAPRGASAAVSRPVPGTGKPGYVPSGAPTASSYSAAEAAQMGRVKANANSPMAGANRAALAQANLGLPVQPRQAPGVMGANRPPAPGAQQPPRPMSMDVSTSAGRRVKPAMTGYEPTLAKMAGANFIKWAMSVSAQGEPGTPSGGEDGDSSQTLFPQTSDRPGSKPAMELYDALKHLSPKGMRGLQQAQPGT